MTNEEMVEFLEHDQLNCDTSRPVPRARFSPALNSALWALRGFGVLISAMVIYAFVYQVS